MSYYLRVTRECSFEELRPEFQQAFRATLEQRKLGDQDPQAWRCCETISTQAEGKGLPAWLTGETQKSFTTAIILGEELMMWGRAAENAKKPPQISGTTLYDIRARWFSGLITKDCGLKITCILLGSTRITQGRILMEDSPAARKFCESVTEAIEKVNPTPKRKLPAWMIGQ